MDFNVTVFKLDVDDFSHLLTNEVDYLREETALISYSLLLFPQNLFFLSTDEDSDVRKNVCRALVMLIEVRMDRLMPHINNLVEVREVFILQSFDISIDPA